MGEEITVRDPLGVYRDLDSDGGQPAARKPNNLRRSLSYWLFNPDPTVVWARLAVKHPMVLQALKETAFILSSSPPESSHFGAWKLSQRLKIPHIVDMRDGWLDEPLKPLLRNSALRRWQEGRMESRILRDVILRRTIIMDNLKITFGIIVLNGEPFIGYNLRSLYPFAHQIIVVEGACPAAAKVANVDGHSRDSTLETLRRFKDEEDIDNKLLIVTAELEGHCDGFWAEKDEMSQAYAHRATGNYLWQVDSDEFYRPEDLSVMHEMLKSDPSISEVSFRTLTFWGGLKCKVDGILLRLGNQDVHRLFSWKPGYRYLTHRPPTVVDEQGRNIVNIKSVSADQLAERGIFLYHYEYLFPIQVFNKVEYYSNAPHCQGLRPDQKWVDECYMSITKPFRVHNIYRWLSWLERFDGDHPPLVVEMIRDVSENKFPWVSKRHTADIDTLLNAKSYAVGIFCLKIAMPFIRAYHFIKLEFRAQAIRIGLWPYLKWLRGRCFGT